MDFRDVRAHIASLRDETYLLQSLADVLSPQAVTFQDVSEKRRIEVLAAHGVYGKILRDEDVSFFAPRNSDELADVFGSFFPQAQLPDELQLPSTTSVSITYADTVASIKRLGRGKACGPTGWCKELLLPLLHSPPPPVQMAVASVFSAILAVSSLTESERGILTTSWAVLLHYRKKNKVRPIAVRDCLAKVLWSHLISTCKKSILLPGSSFGRPGGCAAVAVALQQLLDDNKLILQLDGHNAFNCVSRQAVFDWVRSKGAAMHIFYPFLNLFYSAITFTKFADPFGQVLFTQPVSVGASQGCSSGPWFFHIGTFSAIKSLQGSPVGCLSVADDMYIFDRENGEVCVVIREFIDKLMAVGVHVRGQKTRILCSKAAAAKAALIAALFAVCPIVHYPTDVLGTILWPDNSPNLQLNLRTQWSLLPPMQRLQNAFVRVSQLETSLFIKLQLLRFVQCKYVYLLSSCAHQLKDGICAEIVELVKSAIFALFGLQPSLSGEGPSTHSYLIFTPLEEEGLGFYPVLGPRGTSL